MSRSVRPIGTADARASDETLGYLRRRMTPTPLQVLLLLSALYFLAAEEQFAWVFVSLLALGVTVFLRAPRWACYGVLSVSLLLLIARFVFQISTGPQDAGSDRDEAVEIGAQALLGGQNPWAQTTHRLSPITSGPASIIFALPWVWVFHRINELTFVSYVALFTLLFAGDVRCQNNTFLALGLFFLAGFFGFHHTLYWSLDELYYAYAALVAAWIVLQRRWLVGAGVCLACAIGSRASYVFPVFALLCWYWYGRRPSARDLARLGAGALLGFLLIAAPFWLVASSDLRAHNPLIAAGSLLETAWPDTNPLFRGLNLVARLVGPPAMNVLKLGASFAVIWYASLRLQRVDLPHPFWHVCLGGFLADMSVYRAGLQNDYVLFFVIPAFIAIAYSGAGRTPASLPVRQPAGGRRARR